MVSQLKLSLDFGKEFKTQLEREMRAELEVAQDKWGVTVTPDEARAIIGHSLEQLKLRVRSFSGDTDWDLSPKLKYYVNGMAGTYTLPSGKALAAKIYLVRTSDSWVVEPDNSSIDSVKLGDFLEVARREIYTWARTGVFYGVGSYKN